MEQSVNNKNKSFKNQLGSGVFYTAIAKYSSIIISLGVTAVLSRLLTPKDFGIIAVATVFIVFFAIFSDMGIGPAIIQKRNLSEKDYSSLFSFTGYLGVILAVIFFFSSWLIADFYKDYRLIPICQILSVNIIFATWNIVPNGLLLKDKKFKFIGIRTLIVQIALAVASISAALLGAGVYALLINPVGSSILIFILSYWKYPVKLTLLPKLDAIRKIASYSIYNFGFSLINYFTRNLDKLLIGKVFNMSELGYYEKSYRLMLLPVQNLTHVITPVLHPVLADYQDNLQEQASKYFKLLRFLTIIGFPLSAFLFFSAKDLILLIFGSQWLPSVPVFRILSLSVGLQIVGSTTGSFFQAINRTKQLFIVGVINTLIMIASLLTGIYVIKSIEGVAWMIVGSFYLGLWIYVYLAKLSGVNVKCAFDCFLIAIMPTLLLSGILWCIYEFVDVSLFLSLFLKTIPLGVIVFGALQHYKIVNVKSFINRFYLKLLKR